MLWLRRRKRRATANLIFLAGLGTPLKTNFSRPSVVLEVAGTAVGLDLIKINPSYACPSPTVEQRIYVE